MSLCQSDHSSRGALPNVCVCEFYREVSIMSRLWTTRVCCTMGGEGGRYLTHSWHHHCVAGLRTITRRNPVSASCSVCCFLWLSICCLPWSYLVVTWFCGLFVFVFMLILLHTVLWSQSLLQWLYRTVVVCIPIYLSNNTKSSWD